MDTIYTIVKGLHNLMRWIVVITAILALVRAYSGWLRKRPWADADRRAGLFFGISMDIQLLLGLLLYFFLSPITRQVFSDFGGAMANADQRFFGLEHILYMLVAVITAHVGSAMAKRAEDPVRKHRSAALWYTLAALLLVLGIPWSRPLIPFMVP